VFQLGTLSVHADDITELTDASMPSKTMLAWGGWLKYAGTPRQMTGHFGSAIRWMQTGTPGQVISDS